MAAPDDARATGGREGGPPVRVVLVEDHDNVRRQLVRLLRAAGFEVTACGTLGDGWRAVAADPPDVVVLDNHLPDGLGTDLCRRIGDRLPRVRVVVYSARLTPDDIDRARRAGAAAVVPKTFSVADLVEAIRPGPDRALSGGHGDPSASERMA